jgi:hypothetical protein
MEISASTWLEELNGLGTGGIDLLQFDLLQPWKKGSIELQRYVLEGRAI